MSSPFKYALFFICISVSMAPIAFAEKNTLGEEISILDNDVLDQEINKLNSLNLNSAASPSKTQNYQANKAEINLWQRIYSRYDIKNENNSRSKKYEDWYSARPEYVERMMDRSQKYLFYVVGEVEKRGMPSEIALLPMIESAYNPIANSRSKAVGIWQFIPSTGRLYGLNQDWWHDKRRNVVEATNAALDYLQKLHTLFGSWDLALAAYNAGEGRVKRWRKQYLTSDSILHNIENIPFSETRKYVKLIFRNIFFYKLMNDESAKINLADSNKPNKIFDIYLGFNK